VTDAHIQQTAIQAGLEETLHQLNQEMSTLLGKIYENGVDLSGGQWQKLAIARSLISPTPIKIMDEPTAALDPLSENQLYQTFAQLMEGKTSKKKKMKSKKGNEFKAYWVLKNQRVECEF